ncbi:amidohydrolase [Thermodesulfatator indicus DSM 15286]|uniref:5-methylthioadenosine/S-adenosylhomocysteine deaminase n=1 Tax=Thermodesulfatator indicus (strain DSM 15286 / JCM 11887 / CIR29812) TaxID=667014 RepID=F8A813_THEID|nr:amidohydrolase [Thermodesulfatator indicus]AEH45006.1 amidohydrolase [Thermodesulfatator indicus DSM 15286]
MQIICAQYIISGGHEIPLIDSAIVVENGKILDMGAKDDIVSRYPLAEIIDFGDSIIFPGLVNAHTHASMTIFRGLADDLPLMTWLENYIFPVERHLKPEWVYWGAKLAIAEMLRSGITLFADMYLFEEEVIKAVEETGIRATLGEGLFDFPSPNYGPLEKGLALTEKLLKDYAGHPRIKVMVCPHAAYTCSPDTLKAAAAIAERYDTLIHIHLSETKDEVALIKARYGQTPPFHLDSLGLLNERLLVAHAVQLTDEEIELLAKRQVKVAHCPESNLKLGSGVAPVPALLEAGVCVGIGTDGPASNNDLDLIGEMRSAALIQKGLTFDPTKLPAKDALNMATSLGAKALGWPELGRLVKDSPADLAVIKLSSSHLTPCYDPLSILVYSARAGDVTDVMVAGEFIMRDGRILTFDEEEAKKKVFEISQEIKTLLAGQN